MIVTLPPVACGVAVLRAAIRARVASKRVGAEMYFLPVDKQTHSESLLVLDGDGKIQGRFSWKDAAEVAKMKALLSELLVKYPPSAKDSSPASAG